MSDIYATEEELLAFDLKDWPTAPKTIDSFRAIVREHAGKMIDGVFVDMQTANAIVTVYDALKPETQLLFEQCSLSRMASIAWKAVR